MQRCLLASEIFQWKCFSHWHLTADIAIDVIATNAVSGFLMRLPWSHARSPADRVTDTHTHTQACPASPNGERLPWGCCCCHTTTTAAAGRHYLIIAPFGQRVSHGKHRFINRRRQTFGGNSFVANISIIIIIVIAVMATQQVTHDTPDADAEAK